MAVQILCSDEVCSECHSIVANVYNELRRLGHGDRAAFASAVHVLELRHPGHNRDHYIDLAAKWIAAERLDPAYGEQAKGAS